MATNNNSSGNNQTNNSNYLAELIAQAKYL